MKEGLRSPLQEPLEGKIVHRFHTLIHDLAYAENFEVPESIEEAIGLLWASLQQAVKEKKIFLLPDTFGRKHSAGKNLLFSTDSVGEGKGSFGYIIIPKQFFETTAKSERYEQVVSIASRVKDFITGDYERLVSTGEGYIIERNALNLKQEFRAAREIYTRRIWRERQERRSRRF